MKTANGHFELFSILMLAGEWTLCLGIKKLSTGLKALNWYEQKEVY